MHYTCGSLNENDFLDTKVERKGERSHGGKSDSKIEKSARDFESMLLSNWLQQAEQSMASVPGADDDEDAGTREQMMSLGVQQLATSIAASGGLGIGKMIAKAMHANADKANAQSAAPEAAAEPARNSENKRLID